MYMPRDWDRVMAEDRAFKKARTTAEIQKLLPHVSIAKLQRVLAILQED